MALIVPKHPSVLCIVEVLSALGLSVGNKGSMNQADKTFEKLDNVSIFIHATTEIHRILFAVRTDNSMELTLKKVLLYCRHHYEEYHD
jgi:hypothetical protein